jgi:hypothetical protein
VASKSFQKTPLYGLFASRHGLRVIVFNDIETACKWLGTDPKEAEQMVKLLRARMRGETSGRGESVFLYRLLPQPYQKRLTLSLESDCLRTSPTNVMESRLEPYPVTLSLSPLWARRLACARRCEGRWQTRLNGQLLKQMLDASGTQSSLTAQPSHRTRPWNSRLPANSP